MIGGGMLMCAVGAMILIAWWSMPRDGEIDPSTGLLALKTPSARTVARKQERGRRRSRRPASPDIADAAVVPPDEGDDVREPRKRNRRPDPAKRRRRR